MGPDHCKQLFTIVCFLHYILSDVELGKQNGGDLSEPHIAGRCVHVCACVYVCVYVCVGAQSCFKTDSPSPQVAVDHCMA